ncbi:MAG: HEPN domain-containing protein [Fusobacteriaceae bacterium]|jgi:HEPN domain-containing protein|nr:HEPN domain-containing protein [Fusobacteriaceae bacterium]
MPDLETAKLWMKFARDDLSFAKHGLTMRPVPMEIICYHCQQTAEKAFKSVLAYYEETIPKTHDLAYLLALCETYNKCVLDLADEAMRLTKYAVAARYPEEIDILESDMDLALADAETIFVLIESIYGLHTD